MSEKPHLNMVLIGHVDHGKSTLMGHVLYLRGFVDDRTIAEYAAESQKTGMGDTWKYAWVLDKLKEERERGLTIDLSFWKFETDKYFFTIIDAPGHRDFVKNMITGTSQADVALLVVSAKKGEFEAGISAGGQTREHAFLAKTLGVDQIIVAVNKMDDPTVNWDQKRYEEVKSAVGSLLKSAGYDIAKVPFIPVSAWTGDDLADLSDKMPWYKDQTLIKAFDTLSVPPKPIDKPLRIPIQDVYSIKGVGTVPVGRVETGVLKEGDAVVFTPTGLKGEVKSIETHHVRIPKAIPGDNIGFNVRGVTREQIRRGDVACHVDNPSPSVNEFVGQIFVIYHPTAIAPGYTPVLHIHTCQIACRFVELLKKVDPRTGQVVEEKPSFLKTGDSAIVKLKPLKPVALEVFSVIPQLGRFAVRDMGMTIAAGVVKEITEKA
jgi:elongation factor 1-alpha